MNDVADKLVPDVPSPPRDDTNELLELAKQQAEYIASKQPEVEADANAIHDARIKAETDTDALSATAARYEETHAKAQSLHEESEKQLNDIQAHINTATEEYNELKTLHGKFAELKKTLEADIRALLPNAATASLAYGYVESKGRYGPLPYDEKALKQKGRFSRVSHFFKEYAQPIISYTIFFVPLLLMAWLFMDLFKELADKGVDGQINTPLLVLRVLISIPLLAISLFGLNTIILNRRLFE